MNIYQTIDELLGEANLALLIQEEEKVKQRLGQLSKRKVIPISA